jgi:imidazolonepropionase
MASRLLYNIRQLVNTRMESHPLRGPELAQLPVIDDAWLLIEDEHIASFGPMSVLPPDVQLLMGTGAAFDVSGCLVLPAWVDSHTHLVFSGSRESEFVDKLKGLSYAEINARGGGILNSARRLAETSEEVLFAEATATGVEPIGHRRYRDKKRLWVDDGRRAQDAAGHPSP